jgi:outer membrane protein TolC
LPAPSRALPLLTVTLLLGCSTYPQRPAAPVFPEEPVYSSVEPTGDVVDRGAGPWWYHAVAAPLADAVGSMLAANPTLREREAVVAAAQARLSRAEADAGAEVELRGELRAQKSSGDDLADSRSAALDASLPLDLNGALARNVEAARLLLQAETAALAQLRHDLARDYLLALLDAAEAAERLALLNEQLAIAEELLRLIGLRFAQGIATGVDVLQQRDQVAALRQQVPAAELARRQAENRLRLLAARHPGLPAGPAGNRLPPVAAPGPAPAPLQLLQSRPGLRAAQARLAAADARFAEALAERWPSLDLSGSLVQRVVSGDVSTLVSAALGAAFTLFDGGAKAAVARERRAELEAAGARYLGDWFEAVIALDDLRLARTGLEARIALSQERLQTADELLRAAQRRYERGVSDYLPVLDALRDLQQQQRDHLALRAELARTLVRLHHAGGESAPEETP